MANRRPNSGRRLLLLWLAAFYWAPRIAPTRHADAPRRPPPTLLESDRPTRRAPLLEIAAVVEYIEWSNELLGGVTAKSQRTLPRDGPHDAHRWRLLSVPVVRSGHAESDMRDYNKSTMVATCANPPPGSGRDAACGGTCVVPHFAQTHRADMQQPVWLGRRDEATHMCKSTTAQPERSRQSGERRARFLQRTVGRARLFGAAQVPAFEIATCAVARRSILPTPPTSHADEKRTHSRTRTDTHFCTMISSCWKH